MPANTYLLIWREPSRLCAVPVDDVVRRAQGKYAGQWHPGKVGDGGSELDSLSPLSSPRCGERATVRFLLNRPEAPSFVSFPPELKHEHLDA